MGEVVTPTNLPTVIVTVEPGFACDAPAGCCDCTIPSWIGSLTSCGWMDTRNPEARSCCTASACARVVTSGTLVVCGPLETRKAMVAPGTWYVPASGLWLTTVPFGSSDSTSAPRATAKPLACRMLEALANDDPMTVGTLIGCGPLETLPVTRASS